MAHPFTFLRQFARRPGATGAVMPSSRRLARRMIEAAAPASDAVVVEYGPGTGSFTSLILASLRPGQRFFAIEINPEFRAALLRRHPDLAVYQGCCSEIRNCCVQEGVDGVDCVISGLPWAVFPDALQTRILDATMAALRPGGRFVTFAYTHGLILPAARRFRRKVLERFPVVRRTRTVWRNLPPACCFVCEKEPAPGAATGKENP